MRRILGVTLTGLGAFLIAVAVLFRFYLPGQAIKDPLNYYSFVTLTGQNATCLDPQLGTEVSNANADAYSTLSGDVKAGSSSTAVWNQVTGVFCNVSGQPRFVIEYTSQRSAFNRRTGETVNCCGAEVQTSSGISRANQSGLAWAFPIGTGKQTYQIFNATLMRAVPASYEGTTTVDGLSVYKFVEHVSDQQFGTQTVPANVAGISGTGEVTLPEYLTATYTFYVDPATGVPVSQQQIVDETLQNAGATATVLFNGTLSTAAKSVQASVNYANSQHTKINLVTIIVPLVGLVLGIVALVIGIVLLVGSEESGRRRAHAEPLDLLAEARPAEAGRAEAGQAEAVPAENGRAEAGGAGTSAVGAASAEAGTADNGAAPAPAAAGPADNGAAPASAAPASADSASAAEASATEAGAPAKAGPAEVGPAGAARDEAGPAGAARDEAGQAEAGPADAGT